MEMRKCGDKFVGGGGASYREQRFLTMSLAARRLLPPPAKAARAPSLYLFQEVKAALEYRNRVAHSS